MKNYGIELEGAIEYDFIDGVSRNNFYTGNTIPAFAGENVSFGDLVQYRSDEKFWKSDASVEDTSNGFITISAETISQDASGSFLVKGIIRDDSWNWTVGDELYVSTLSGEITGSNYAPSASGEIARIIGYAKNATHIWFDPEKSYIES